MHCEYLKVGEDYEQSIIHKYSMYLENRFKKEGEALFFHSREVIILIISKSQADFNGFYNNQSISQSKHPEWVYSTKIWNQEFK